MIIKNEPLILNWVLRAGEHAVNYVTQVDFDLQVTAPNGVVTYLEGSLIPNPNPDKNINLINGATVDWTTDFTAPTTSTDGFIACTITPDQDGVYTFILGKGGSEYFYIIDTSNLLVVAKTTTHLERVNLPPIPVV